MEEAQEPVQDILPMNTSPEPVSQHCLAHSDLLPEITPPPQNNSTGTSPNSIPPDPKTYLQNLLPLTTLYLLTVYCQLTLAIPQQIM